MVIQKIAPLFNIFIKGLTLLGKFGLVFYMAKYLEPSDIGIYGLLIALISYSLYAIGLDFYTYSTRELVKIEKNKWWKYIKSQLVLITIAYIFIFPIILYVVYNILGLKWICFFIILLILEHLNQEIIRLLIALHRNIWANNLNFIRQGLWCFILVLFIEISWLTATLNNVLYLWIIFSFLAFLIGIALLKNDIKITYSAIDFCWLKKGLKVSGMLLIATLCIRTITTLDRIWIEYLDGLVVVGAYSLYFSLTNSLIAFLDTGVFSFIYPKMIRDVNDKNLFLSHIKNLFIQTVVFLFLTSTVLFLLIPILLNWIGKDVYISYISLFYVILAANILYCLSMVFHYILYALNKDKNIFKSQVFSLCVFVLSTFALSIMNIEQPVAIGLLLAFLCLFIFKLFYAVQLIKF